jgi:CHAT domain-containing protein
VSRADIAAQLDAGRVEEAVGLLDIFYSEQLGDYLDRNIRRDLRTFSALQQKIVMRARPTGTNPAMLYTFARERQLDLVLVPSEGEPIYESIREANRENLMQVVQEFRREITDPKRRFTTSYRSSAKQLYEWIIAPLEEQLKARDIDTLIFSMDEGLRGIPVAAFYDGDRFLVERYAIALIPSLNLTDLSYKPLEDAEILAMGASQFTARPPLHAVPVELSSITEEWPGESFLNQTFTLDNLKNKRDAEQYQIIHLATHAEFLPGEPSNSYIQFWDTTLPVYKIRELDWHEPPVELLVLSACRTAIGDNQAELGFAGLAVQAGVQSALASLWYISDEGTVALMNEFYHQLNQKLPNEGEESGRVAIKAEALRYAQMAMIEGEWQIESGRLIGMMPREEIPRPPALSQLDNENLQHPYYWAAFIIVGSPW